MKIDPVMLWESDAASFTPTKFVIPADWNLSNGSAQFEAFEIAVFSSNIMQG